MNTAIIITGIICSSLVLMTAIKWITEIIDRKHYYDAKAKNPEAFIINEEDLKNGN